MNIPEDVLEKGKAFSSELAEQSFGHLQKCDLRLAKRVIKIAKARNSAPNKKFSLIFPVASEKKAGYRVLKNAHLTSKDLSQAISFGCKDRLSELAPIEVLIPQDTTWFTVPKSRKISGMGKTSGSHHKGFYLQTAMALTTDGIPIGVMDLQAYTRPWKKPKKDRKHLPIEEKESYRWLVATQNVFSSFPENIKPIFLSDRESDIHEYIDLLQKQNASFVIRIQHNRRIDDGNSHVKDSLKEAEPLGRYTITIPRGHGRQERTVRVTLQNLKVKFHLRKGGLAIHRSRVPLEVNALRLIEDPSDEVDEPIEWLLYTDLPIETLSQAKRVIRLYTMRWRIEEFHLALKSGMAVEEQRFESLDAYLKWICISAPMACKILEILLQSRATPKLAAETILSPEEYQAVRLLTKRQTGRLPRKLTLEKVVKHVAMAGGWMGRKGDGPPGIRTFWRGWKDIQVMAGTIMMLNESTCKTYG